MTYGKHTLDTKCVSDDTLQNSGVTFVFQHSASYKPPALMPTAYHTNCEEHHTPSVLTAYHTNCEEHRTPSVLTAYHTNCEEHRTPSVLTAYHTNCEEHHTPSVLTAYHTNSWSEVNYTIAYYLIRRQTYFTFLLCLGCHQNQKISQ